MPQWIEQAQLDPSQPPLIDFKIYRCYTPSGSCTPGATVYATVGDTVTRSYVDSSLPYPNYTYSYRVTFRYKGYGCATTNESPLSNIASAQTCPLPPNGPMDVAFIVDNTSSTENGILSQLQTGLTTILDEIQSSSGNNYRLALVTPCSNEWLSPDLVDVRLPFASNNRADFVTQLGSTVVSFGGGFCESTDECLNTVVNALASAGRTMSGYSCPPHSAQQIGDFPGFRTGSGIRRYIVLITDAPPSGFCDKDESVYNPSSDGQRALGFAQQARSTCIKINAIQVDKSPVDTDPGSPLTDELAQPVMTGYAQDSCGWYSNLPHNATGMGEAVVKMLYSAGTCSCQ